MGKTLVEREGGALTKESYARKPLICPNEAAGPHPAHVMIGQDETSVLARVRATCSARPALSSHRRRTLRRRTARRRRSAAGRESRKLLVEFGRTALVALGLGPAGRHELLKCVSAIAANVFVNRHGGVTSGWSFDAEHHSNDTIPDRSPTGNRICITRQTPIRRTTEFFSNFLSDRSPNNRITGIILTP